MAVESIVNTVLLASTAVVCATILFVGVVRTVYLKKSARTSGRAGYVAALWAEEYRWVANCTVVYLILALLAWSLFMPGATGPMLLVAVFLVTWNVGLQRFSRTMTRFWARVYFGTAPDEPQKGLWEPVWPFPLREVR